MPQPSKSPPNKKAKYGPQSSERFSFKSVNDIQQALRIPQDPNLLSQAIFSLRSKLSFISGETISPQDERLSLAKLWMAAAPAGEDLFNIWERATDMSTQTLVTSLFASLLSLFSCHLTDHSYGVAIIKAILSPRWSRKLNSYIGGNNNEQILVTLKLFNAISTFGSGRERKSVFEAFPWDNKSLSKLLFMRRRGKESERNDILGRPDIRTYYVLFILSMVDKNSVPSMKATFLEQRREVFMSIFKGLIQDHYTVLQKVLQVCWEDIWLDPKIKRTIKVGLFNEVTIAHILKLYDRTAAEGPEGQHIPADVVHHFLLAICTHPGQGICFRDRGWYPRETDEGVAADPEDREGSQRKGGCTGKIYNKMLANTLPMLKVNEDPRQQGLALKIMEACPELVAGYWPAASLTLEPRLSSKWISNISFAGQVLSQAVPVHSFILPSSNELYNPTPPPLSVVMANVFPSAGTKAFFTKGLQVPSTGLVQHCTALVLAKCLRKLAEIVRVFRAVGTALEEEEEGQWSRHRREVEKEARRRVPEFQVIVAYSQQHSLTSSNVTKHTLLSESAQRLLWLYQECLPDVVAEARFEVGKLVLSLVEGSLASLSAEHGDGPAEQKDGGMEAPMALQGAKHLHILRLLATSDQFTWTGKVASSSHTYFYVLLKTLCSSRVRALRATLEGLLQNVLSESVLFQEDPNEVKMWLASLPLYSVRRGEDTQAPDNASLTDEAEAAVTFLDDCVQRCLKTPYRYVEAMFALAESSGSTKQGALFASPLLMTVLEQVTAKVGARLVTPSDALAIFTFIRRLLVMLAAKQDDSQYRSLLAALNQLDNSVGGRQPFPDHPSVYFGIRRELSIIRACLSHLEDGYYSGTNGTSEPAVIDFLNRIEQVPVPPSESARMATAFELIDWLRLVDVTPSSADIFRLASVVRRFYEPALWLLISYLHPSHGHLWYSGILKLLPRWPPIDGIFDWVYLHCTLPHLQDRQSRGLLVTALYAHPATLITLKNAVRRLVRGISVSAGRHDLTAALFALLSDVLTSAKSHLREKDLQELKATVMGFDTIRGFCLAEESDEAHEAIQEFIAGSFNPSDVDDQECLSSVCAHWAEIMSRPLSSCEFDVLKYAQPWVKFMSTGELLKAVDIFQFEVGRPSTIVCDLLEAILGALQHRISQGSSIDIPVSKLLKLQGVLATSTVLEDMLSVALLSQLPLGLGEQVCFVDGRPLATVLSRGGQTIMSEHQVHSSNLLSRVLKKEHWTDSTGSIIITLLYSNATSVQIFAAWLSMNSHQWTRLSIHSFAPVLATFFDCLMMTSRDLSQMDDDILYGLLGQLFPSQQSLGTGFTWHLECIQKIVELLDTRRARFVSALQERIQSLPFMHFTFERTFLARKLLGVSSCDIFVTSIVEHALQWAVRVLSADTPALDDLSNMALENLKYVLKHHKILKPHLVEPLLTILVQRYLSDTSRLDLAITLANRTPLKPVVANRLLQNALQHERFVEVCGKHGSPLQRDRLSHLLDTLFRMHPSNSCQPSHIEPLFQVYGGTMSAPDRRLLAIMRLFEAEKHTSLSAFFSLWSSSPDVTVSNVLEVVQSFDPVYMLRTCLAFPMWRRFAEEAKAKESPGDASMYDPLVVIALCAQMLAESPPTTPLGWVKVFRSNVVSLVIRCLSSKDPNMRETALCQIANLWKSVQESEMHETPQVLHVFRLLKNVIHAPATANDPPRRLPTYTTLILLHALRGIFYPSNFIYPRTARFLLQRPELDVSDVPLLFGMLYSSSADDWKKERGWILRMLGDGMTSTQDWKVLKRRHTWDLVASLFQSSRNDTTMRNSILEILANLTCNSEACTSLALKSSLLSWIEIQVGDSTVKETMAWLRILENIIVVSDASKLTRAMGDQWCSIVCRCICSLLRRKDTEMAVLWQAATCVLVCMMKFLEHLEPGIRLHPDHLHQSPFGTVERNSPLNPLARPPHRGQGLHEIPTMTEPSSSLWAWGEIVEALWRAAMTFVDDRNKGQLWAMLTRRLIVWRAFVGEEASPIGEWARKEVAGLLLGYTDALLAPLSRLPASGGT